MGVWISRRHRPVQVDALACWRAWRCRSGGARVGVVADLGHADGPVAAQARATRHAYWFPLVLFGALIAASSPFFVEQMPTPGVTIWVTGADPLPTFGGMFQPAGADVAAERLPARQRSCAQVSLRMDE